MSAAVKIARFVNLLCGGLYAGLLVAVLCVEVTLRGVGPDVYTIVEQVKHANLNVLAAATIVPTLASGALLLVLAREPRGWAFALTLVGLLCAVVALTITLLVNVPINAAQLAWSPQAPPADWAAIRDRWQLAHTLRTTAAIAGLSCQILATLMPAPISQVAEGVSRHSRGATPARPPAAAAPPFRHRRR